MGWSETYPMVHRSLAPEYRGLPVEQAPVVGKALPGALAGAASGAPLGLPGIIGGATRSPSRTTSPPRSSRC